MSTQTGLGRRIEQTIQRLQAQDPESALVNLFPAIDKTAKKRRPKDRVGTRIKSFLKDNEVLISVIGMGSVFRDCSFNGLCFEEALYKFGRTSIVHEGELDPMLSFTQGGSILIGSQGWRLPVSYIVGMSVSVIVAPENAGERVDASIGVSILNTYFPLEPIWGNAEPIKAHICEKFRDAALFEPAQSGLAASSRKPP